MVLNWTNSKIGVEEVWIYLQNREFGLTSR